MAREGRRAGYSVIGRDGAVAEREGGMGGVLFAEEVEV